jgi:hypothetical protein
MMNHRATVRAHTHWRPRPAARVSVLGDTNRSRGSRRWRLRLVVLLAVVAAGAGAFMLLRGQSSEVLALPATPMAWLDAFSAGVARDSPDVCSRLLSPSFRAALEREVHRSCASYYAHTEVLSVRALQVLRSGETAAIEVRYWPRGRYSTFVLDHHRGGWLAVAIVPGGPLPVA